MSTFGFIVVSDLDSSGKQFDKYPLDTDSESVTAAILTRLFKTY